MITDELKDAFRWHMQHPRRVVGLHGLQRPIGYHAVAALMHARADLAAGKTRYPDPVKPYPAVSWQPDQPGLAHVEKPENAGLRFVGRVEADCGGRNGIWDNSDSSGWYTGPYGDWSTVCHGVVYQLPGRNGESRFVAGYQFTDCDGGPTLDLSNVYSEPAAFYEPVRKTSTGTYGGYWSYQDNPREMDAAHDAARAADSMAKAAAEAEREYQTAWQAGSRYSDESHDLQAIRQEVRGILAERRALKGQSGYPALCKAIAARVRDLLDDMAERRDKMRELANGMFGDLAFYTGDKNLAAAFNEGAGESVLPC